MDSFYWALPWIEQWSLERLGRVGISHQKESKRELEKELEAVGRNEERVKERSRLMLLNEVKKTQTPQYIPGL